MVWNCDKEQRSFFCKRLETPFSLCKLFILKLFDKCSGVKKNGMFSWLELLGNVKYLSA